VEAILNSRGFYNDMNHLAKVLLPIKNAILALERQTANLADNYIYLIKIGDAINKLPENAYKGFRAHCVKIYNERYVV
jgi:hypothetical protein